MRHKPHSRYIILGGLAQLNIRFTFSTFYLYLYKNKVDMANPKRNKESYYTESYQQKQAEKIDRNFGPIKVHKKVCEKCGNDYEIEGRVKTKKIINSRFCSRSCANHRGVGVEWEKTHKSRSLISYKTICFTEWEQKCVICGFDKVISVHHIDEDHKNNDIKNLIPLCPNHHHMVHTKEYGSEMKLEINKIVSEKWGIS